VTDRAGIEQAISPLCGQAGNGLVALPGPVNNTLRDSIIKLAAQCHVPAIYPFKYYAKDGGLLYYGIDQVDQWPKAAEYVDRILKGERPSELPLQALDQIRAGYQPDNREGAWYRSAADIARARRRGDRIESWFAAIAHSRFWHEV
jgi:ABC transporter substrate binding protein